MSRVVRNVLTALLTAAIVACMPAGAGADDGGAKPLTDAESYALTCGHLGVPCATPHKHRGRHARRARPRRD